MQNKMFTIGEIDSIVEKGLRTLDWKQEPGELYEPIEYLISIGGKRLRPRMAVLCHSLFNDIIDNSILYPALALEIFHGFTLIHDDIMDGASLRRSQPTVHKKWNNNIAILSGDVMCIKSYQLLTHAPESKLREVMNIFTDTAAKVCEGQQFDMNYESLPVITTEEYLRMIGLKTAVLIACSAKIGAVTGGATPATADAIYNYAYKLGLAFQIKDDLLDSFGETEVFGKAIGGDIMSNKKTWLLVESLRRATGEDMKALQDLLAASNPKPEIKIAAMRALYEKLGVKEAADRAICNLHNEAEKALDSASLRDDQRSQLSDFAKSLLNREK